MHSGNTALNLEARKCFTLEYFVTVLYVDSTQAGEKLLPKKGWLGCGFPQGFIAGFCFSIPLLKANPHGSLSCCLLEHGVDFCFCAGVVLFLLCCYALLFVCMI